MQAPTKALQTALVQARNTGHLKLRGRGLAALPDLAFDIGAVPLPEGQGVWWETRETLETLDASENDVRSIPDALASLVDLRELHLTHNAIGELPRAEVWAELAALVSFMCGHNQLVSLPEGFGGRNAPPLVRLSLPSNRLCRLPSTLGQLVDLVELDLSCNQVCDTRCSYSTSPLSARTCDSPPQPCD